MTQYETKDSGARAQFESGMQRDTEDGKPRFDLLLPLDVPYEDQFLTRVAALLGRGAVKYESRNWEQADSQAELDRMKSSAYRHFMQWITGETDEDHAAAVVFNLLAHETTSYKMRVKQGAELPPQSVPTQDRVNKTIQDRINKAMANLFIQQPEIPELLEKPMSAREAVTPPVPPIEIHVGREFSLEPSALEYIHRYYSGRNLT